MSKERRVTVLEWPNAPDDPAWDYSVNCENCGADLLLPSAPGTRIIATTGMGMIFDNTKQPPNATPTVVKCPVCRRVYEKKKEVLA